MAPTLSAEPLTLRFLRPFAISRGRRAAAENVVVCIDHEGITGWGEGAPNPYYCGQSQRRR